MGEGCMEAQPSMRVLTPMAPTEGPKRASDPAGCPRPRLQAILLGAPTEGCNLQPGMERTLWQQAGREGGRGMQPALTR